MTNQDIEKVASELTSKEPKEITLYAKAMVILGMKWYRENNETNLSKLKKNCQRSIDNEPKDATEKEKGYTIALQHVIKIIDDQLSK
jgi:hypothetical protein